MLRFFQIKPIIFSILILLLGCSQSTNGISILYLFDTSGSYHKNALPASVDIAERLFNEISSEKDGIGIYPQIHQVSTIETQSVTIGYNCNIKIEQKNIFEDVSDPDFSKCFDLIKNSKRSNYTDINGALLNASNSLGGSGYYGKGIVIFSDLQEDVPKVKDFNFSLDDVSVFVVFELSKNQINNPGLFEKDKQTFLNKLIDAGVDKDDIHFENLKSVNNNPSSVVTFFRSSFRG